MFHQIQIVVTHNITIVMTCFSQDIYHGIIKINYITIGWSIDSTNND